jgi:hypothetical protein
MNEDESVAAARNLRPVVRKGLKRSVGTTPARTMQATLALVVHITSPRVGTTTIRR